MTNKRSRILSLLLAVALLVSAFPIVLPTLTAAAEGDDAQSYLTSPDPGVSVTCTETTWVSAGSGSCSPGTQIVPATDSGLPGSKDSYIYGEQVKQTTITATFTNDLEKGVVPQISCTSGGTNVVFTSPDYTKATKTYTWYLLNGQAEAETVLEFSITYPFNGRNYVNKAYSYVRAVARPAGIYAARLLKTCSGEVDWSDPDTWADLDSWQNLYRNSETYSVDFSTVVIGRNTYYSLGSFTANGYEIYRASYDTGSKNVEPTNSMEYSVVGTRKNLYTASTKYRKGYEEIPCVPRADVYIDSSTSSGIAGMNVRAITNNLITIPDHGKNNGAQLIETSFGGLEASGGGADATGFIGTERVNTITSNVTSGSYTITSQSLCYAQNSDIIFGVKGYITIAVHSVDKGTLRNTINGILAGTLYEDSDPFNVFRCRNKGVNPQQWQFKNNWTQYSTAMRDAVGVLLQPNATQNEIDGANEALITAYDNLQIKSADYTEFNKYKDLAEAAIAKEAAFYQEYEEHWFVAETLANLEAVLEEANENCHILYQPQVDAWTQDLIEAYEGLRVLPADYTSLNAVVAQANDLLDDKLDDGSSIYVNSADLAAAVASVRYDLTKADQDTIVQYENNIRDAISALTIRSADYSEINILKAQAEGLKRSNYTNYNTVIAVLKDISRRSNLKITQQDVVDADAATLRAAINGLTPKPADYSELEELLAEAAALVREYYETESLNAIDAAVAATQGYENINILNQTTIDTYASHLRTALADKVIKPADYTDVDAAIERWQVGIPDTEKAKLQEASVQAVTVAISGVTRDLDISHQAEVDEMALRINNAIDNLEYKGANYSKVESAIAKVDALDRTYYADFSGVDSAVNAVNWYLGLNRQDEVDAMADAILDAIDQLVPGPADYSRVNLAISRFEALNKSYYTRDSVQAVEELINNVNWDLNKDNQAAVITYAFDINEAIFNLVEADADYKELNRVIASIPSNLSSLYTADSIADLTSAVSSVNWSLKARNQDMVDGYVAAINKAMNDLVYLPGDYSEVDRQIAIGRDRIANGVLQPDGTYFEVSAQSAADFEEFVAGLNRSYNIVEVEQIAGVADSVAAKYMAFTYAESIHRAAIKLTTDKDITYQGDVVTVSVIVKTDYAAAACAIPVLYNAAYYDIVGSGASAFTFSDTAYVNGSIVGGNTTSPAKGYPSSYSSSDKNNWKYAYITVAPTSDKGSVAVTLDPEQVIATFQLRVKDNLVVGNDPLNSKIWVDSAFLKTSANKGGKLYIGRYASGSVDTDIIGYGQTVNVTGANKTVKIYDSNSPASTAALSAVLARDTVFDASFYTDDTYAEYEEALAAGQDIIDNIAEYTIKEQAIVDEAVALINSKYDALVLKDADLSLLEAALELTPEYTEDKYTPESYLAFTDAVAAAQAILAEDDLTIVDNERISEAAQAVEDALTDLTLKDCSYIDDLYVIIDTFPMFDESEYDEDAVMDYYDAYDLCDLFLSSDTTILDDDEALGLINDFYAAFVALEKSALAKAIEDCTTSYDSSVYTSASYSAYIAAYNNAVATYESASDREDVGAVQDCVQTLKTRFAGLVINPFLYEDEVWAALDLFPQDEDHTVAESLDAYYEAYDALDMFAMEKCESWTALDNAEALELINALQYAYDNLVIESADVSELVAAINTAPEYAAEMYTTDSYSEYAAALEAGTALINVTYDRQDEVDEAAQAILDALDALELKPFSKLDEVNAALEVQPELSEDEYIDTYWEAYAQARADLEDIVDNADSLTVVDDSDAVEKINAYNEALADLEENGVIPEGDYSAVEEAITNANAKLAQMVETGNELVQSTVDALTAAIEDVDYTLDGLSQDTIDAYAEAINAAADALEFVAKFVIDSEDVTVEDGFVFGFADVASESDITAVFTAIGDASVVVTPTDNGYGTGTLIELVDNKTSETIQSVTIVVMGDANGDGFVDSFDVAIITDLVNTFEDPSDEATLLALDVFTDGWLDNIDLAYVMFNANYE